MSVVRFDFDQRRRSDLIDPQLFTGRQSYSRSVHLPALQTYAATRTPLSSPLARLISYALSLGF